MQPLSIGHSIPIPRPAKPALVPARPVLTHELEQVTQWALPNDTISVVESHSSRKGKPRTVHVKYLDWCMQEAARLRSEGRKGKVRAKLQKSWLAGGTIRMVKVIAVFALVPIESSLPNKDVDEVNDSR